MASNKILELKKEIVSEIKDKVNNSSSVLFFDYRGLTVAEMVELRNKLKKSNSDIKIYKNTLAKLAFNDLKFDMGSVLEGPNAFVLSKASIEPIKVLTEYAKDHKRLTIKGGIIDGNVSSIEELAELATIPSREGLLTMLAGGMMGIVKDLSICLNLYSEQKEA